MNHGQKTKKIDNLQENVDYGLVKDGTKCRLQNVYHQNKIYSPKITLYV